MNFFEQQQRARRASAWLLVLFVLASLMVIALLNLLVAAVAGLYWLQGGGWRYWFTAGYWIWLSAGLLALILFGSVSRMRQLWGHGDLLAQQLGAAFIDPAASDDRTRQLVNLAEEMAVASGMPVPTLWVLSGESGINAFVAGTSMDRVALVVSRGALETLDRPQLQGVVAHEFSHIYHGDMRLNLQLLGVLAGLEYASQFGLRMMRLGHRAGGRGLPLALIAGLALFLVGSLGWFCGRLIRAAFSRQREYLADASAVRYTRNPAGIAGALARIRDSRNGAILRHPRVEEFSHFCFALPLSGFSARWLATHPPLAQRILRIDRYFDLKQRRHDEDRGRRGSTAADSIAAALPGLATAVPLAALTRSAQLLQSLPAPVLAAERSSEKAGALVLALLLDSREPIRSRQVEALNRRYGEAFSGQVVLLHALLDENLETRRLALLDLALPRLRERPRQELADLRDAVLELSAADGQLGLFELLLLTLVGGSLEPAPAALPKIHGFEALASDLNRLFWSLIRTCPGELAADRDFHQRTIRGFLRRPPPLPEIEQLPVADLQRLVRRINRLAPLLKPPVLQACHDCLARDGELSVREAELLRVISALMGAPAGAPARRGSAP